MSDNEVKITAGELKAMMTREALMEAAESIKHQVREGEKRLLLQGFSEDDSRNTALSAVVIAKLAELTVLVDSLMRSTR